MLKDDITLIFQTERTWTQEDADTFIATIQSSLNEIPRAQLHRGERVENAGRLGQIIDTGWESIWDLAGLKGGWEDALYKPDQIIQDTLDMRGIIVPRIEGAIVKNAYGAIGETYEDREAMEKSILDKVGMDSNFNLRKARASKTVKEELMEDNVKIVWPVKKNRISAKARQIVDEVYREEKEKYSKIANTLSSSYDMPDIRLKPLTDTQWAQIPGHFEGTFESNSLEDPSFYATGQQPMSEKFFKEQIRRQLARHYPRALNRWVEEKGGDIYSPNEFSIEDQAEIWAIAGANEANRMNNISPKIGVKREKFTNLQMTKNIIDAFSYPVAEEVKTYPSAFQGKKESYLWEERLRDKHQTIRQQMSQSLRESLTDIFTADISKEEKFNRFLTSAQPLYSKLSTNLRQRGYGGLAEEVEREKEKNELSSYLEKTREVVNQNPDLIGRDERLTEQIENYSRALTDWVVKGYIPKISREKTIKTILSLEDQNEEES